MRARLPPLLYWDPLLLIAALLCIHANISLFIPRPPAPRA
jgi:hypothetical protein